MSDLDFRQCKATAAEMRVNGLTCAEIASILGVSKSWVHKWTPKTGRPHRRWTEEERDKATESYLKGRTCKAIAKKLGRSEQSVRLCVWREIKTRRKRAKTPRAREAERWLWRAIRLGATPEGAMKAVRKAAVMGRGAE